MLRGKNNQLTVLKYYYIVTIDNKYFYTLKTV